MPRRSYADVVSYFRRQIMLADVLAIALSIAAVLYLRGLNIDFSSFDGISELLIIALIPFSLVVFLSGNHSWESEVYLGQLKFYETPLKAALKTLVVVSSFAYLIKEPISRITILTIILTSAVALLAVRLLIGKCNLAKELTSNPAEFLVVATTEEFKSLDESQPIPNHSGSLLIHRPLMAKDCAKEWQEICLQLEKENFAGIVIGESFFPNSETHAQLALLQSKKAIEVYLHSPITTLIPRLQTIENNELIRVARPLLVGRHAVIKRTLDIMLSLPALIVLMPILLLIALGVKFTSPGPVLYIDQRIGRNNKLFSFPKFRSMVVNADQMRSNVLGSPDESMPDRYAQDPRITSFGRFIRRWSLDELPQLWCVLIGTMSIVGPRPILQEEHIDVQEENQSRFIAKPGLTGLWQVSGRKEVLWEARMKQDILYIETWSFLNDLLLIMRTFGTIFYGKGAM
jgi:exopolysaccharide biosynthesis polyprenyl glycosylphosphotransferase